MPTYKELIAMNQRKEVRCVDAHVLHAYPYAH